MEKPNFKKSHIKYSASRHHKVDAVESDRNSLRWEIDFHYTTPELQSFFYEWQAKFAKF